MMKGKGKNKGFGKGKNPRSSRCCMEKVKVDTETTGHGIDPWANSWKGESGVHSVEEQCAWQSGDGTTLFFG